MPTKTLPPSPEPCMAVSPRNMLDPMRRPYNCNQACSLYWLRLVPSQRQRNERLQAWSTPQAAMPCRLESWVFSLEIDNQDLDARQRGRLPCSSATHRDIRGETPQNPCLLQPPPKEPQSCTTLQKHHSRFCRTRHCNQSDHRAGMI